MATVAVIMSTYNGEKYLREQLDSIFAQRDVEVTLFVRDDGSMDDTHAILAEYAQKHTCVFVEFGENVGVGNSFMNALYSTPDTFEYYAFADQDDIWQENKLSEAVKLLNASGKLLYASNQECVDKDGNTLGLRYKTDAVVHTKPPEIMSNNMLAGCTMVMNEQLHDILCEKRNRPSGALLRNRIHDVWVAFVAALYNGIVYDTRSFIRYRQHENNVVGAQSTRKKRRQERRKKIRNAELRNGRSFLAREAVEKFPVAARYPLLAICADGATLRGKKKILKHQKELRSYTKEKYVVFLVKVMFGLF